MNRNRIILSGGGTGGHIYPAISIANELLFRDKNSEILFVGANNKMEMNIVPKYGFDILGLWISGFNRTNFIKNILVPFKLLVSIFKSLIIIKRFKTDIVIGTDPDCDRLGVAVKDNNNEFCLLNGNQTMVLMTYLVFENWLQTGTDHDESLTH